MSAAWGSRKSSFSSTFGAFFGAVGVGSLGASPGLLGPEVWDHLGNEPAGLMGLHVTLLLGLAHDHSLGLIRTLDNLKMNGWNGCYL